MRIACNKKLVSAMFLAVIAGAQERAVGVQPTTRPATLRHVSDNRLWTPELLSEYGPLRGWEPALWDRFVKGLKTTAAYEAGRALSPALVQPQLDKWSGQLSRKLTIAGSGWVDLMLEYSLRERLTVDIGEGRVLTLIPEQAQFKRRPKQFLDQHRYINIVLMLDSQKGKEYAYLVPPESLEPLRFATLRSVAVQHALNQRIEAFQAKNESLTDVVERLCQTVGPQHNFAINSALADPIHMSMRINNRTVAECLRVVAGVADWELSFSFSGQFRPDKPAQIRDAHILFDRVVSVFENRGRDDGIQQDDPEVETPMDALKLWVFDAARRLDEDSYVISLRPQSPKCEERKK